MIESKHTPGPWRRYTGNGDMGIGAGGTTDSGSPEKLIVDGCGCCGSPYGVDDIAEREANARLIAAAPELLEAALNLENDDGHIPSKLWEILQAAIAKATGVAK